MNKIQIISFIKEEELTIKATEMFVTKEIKQEKSDIIGLLITSLN